MYKKAVREGDLKRSCRYKKSECHLFRNGWLRLSPFACCCSPERIEERERRLPRAVLPRDTCFPFLQLSTVCFSNPIVKLCARSDFAF